MASFNAIVQQAAASDRTFYEERGVVLHNLEVVRFEPKDENTRGVLQEIIQETTNHINRMQVQYSDPDPDPEPEPEPEPEPDRDPDPDPDPNPNPNPNPNEATGIGPLPRAGRALLVRG